MNNLKSNFKATIELNNNTSEELRIIARSSFEADRILDKYIKNNRMKVIEMRIKLVFENKNQTERIGLYNVNNDLVVEPPRFEGKELIQGFKWFQSSST